MSGPFDDDAPPAASEQHEDGLDFSRPDVPLPTAESAEEPGAPRRPRSMPMRVVAVAVALTVVAAFGVAAIVNSRDGGVKAAFASVFESPSVRVAVTLDSTNAKEQARIGGYSVAVTVTSADGSQPLSASGGRENYEISVLRKGVDLGDIVAISNDAAFVRLNLMAIAPRDYESALSSLARVPAGAQRDIVSALVHDQWVGVSDGTLKALAKSLGHGAALKAPSANVGSLRSALTLSFAQSWHAWASIHRLPSLDGVTRYSLKLPVRHFVSSFIADSKASVLKDLPTADLPIARRVLNAADAAIARIPAGLAIPMTLYVADGSLTRVVISHSSDTIDLAISHPSTGVTAPRGAVMVTASTLRSYVGGLLPARVSSISSIKVGRIKKELRRSASDSANSSSISSSISSSMSGMSG